MTRSTLPALSDMKEKTKMRKTIKTRILLLSDTHSSLPLPAEGQSQSQLQVPFHTPLPSADVLIHTGDLTMTGSLAEHRSAIQLIRSVDAPLKIVIPGNHDLTLDRDYYSKHHTGLHASYAKYSDEVLAEIQDLYSGPKARDAGVRYMVEGRASYRVPSNGARLNVYASAWQPEFWNWAFGYARDVDRFNLPLPHPETPPETTNSETNPGSTKSEESKPLPDGPENPEEEEEEQSKQGKQGKPPRDKPENPVPDFDDDDDGGKNGVDVMLTHGPPMGILDQTMREGESVGCEHLRRAVERCRPRMHCFGHIHEAWGACRKRWDDDVDESTTTSNNNQEGEGSQGDGRTHAIDPGSYDGLVDRRGAYVDATDLEYGKETLFVNASIMDLQYRPLNAPWVVDLELPVASGDEDEDGQ
ncbi:hypothetical protein LTR99_003956 [Exophiala xenobiotica]|uniref:Calcineurin-like phosphoesterase domain-containing protein n=1 Tax=Vermiconidia calcicola TaxID=1690605 RepID=A0AAV9PX79_9PEZI|nr:hypothetical protein LTR99_003956 [Exophiala xenobiotica]KAK5435423.1 hypothetical protein LTR34_002927 [Exophiala xenobiotica]KAK5529726.1 hypothetical protein LTR25_009505 [Vermiconidia calcicola]KAK5549070.1 hypothetical protein LTR23_000900 [Chaetothyriales sp. CCFEE 6169]